ncbi:hypothetical protein RSOLAG1IB_06755 [Rhizoctonia solani AG-1 IB]|uniref:Uncharacterized protein n=1 Tax=Thanatephorus cucumeris (strain AG1-IB / isolate 7/3/14) TaxID=1108050 RepID=A0A0B7F7L6_THACB|nr:hypothetical protein RSOLAG1IB_06755 [Rhizoctonia solani AG-1 IB]
MRGYLNKRIIKLIDSQAIGREGRYLMMMELGEIDLARPLAEKQGTRLQPHWIAIYWQQQPLPISNDYYLVLVLRLFIDGPSTFAIPTKQLCCHFV